MPAGKTLGRLGGGAAGGAASGAAAGPIGAAVGAGIGLLGSGLSLLGARRHRGETERLLASLRGSNIQQASQLAASQPGLSPGAQIRAAGSVLTGLNARTDPLAAQLAQSETEAERRRRAILFGGLGGALAAAGQVVNLTGEAVDSAQNPLAGAQGMMKPEGGVPMQAPAQQGLLQMPQLPYAPQNQMTQDLRSGFVPGVVGAMQPQQTPMITDPNVAIPPTQNPYAAGGPDSSQAIFENVTGMPWQQPQQRPQQRVPEPPNVNLGFGSPQQLDPVSQALEAAGRERSMVRRHQLLMRAVREQAVGQTFPGVVPPGMAYPPSDEFSDPRFPEQGFRTFGY